MVAGSAGTATSYCSPAREGADDPRPPRFWTELRDLLGTLAARRLAERFGGEQVVVPRKPDPEHCLASAIGDVGLYRHLVSQWGGCQVSIPEMSTALREERNHRIRRRRADGAIARQIAHDEGLSVRRVRNMVSG